MYVKVTNGSVDTYPYSIGQLRRDNQNTSFPKKIPNEMLEDYGVFKVVVEDTPDYDNRTQNAELNSEPSLIDGQWTVDWVVNQKTTEEISHYDEMEASKIRSQRDSKLAETDFYGLSDVTMSAEMTTYRQALRDITDHENFPYLEDADWPVKP